jgi:hypothetical protein
MVDLDTSTYDKARKYPPRHGYQLRGTQPSSIVIHSTNNKVRNTSFPSEANFLFSSPNVSAHYLVSKTGRIVRFLDPAPWQAWHVGEAKPEWANARSVGIELHHSVGDGIYPTAQIVALTWLVRDLMQAFRIPIARIETHRAVALPPGRKVDPSDWIDPSFYSWRSALVPALPPAPPAPLPTPPLATHTLPAPAGATRRCGEGFHRFYAECGGMARLGYALTDETQEEDCTWLRCERAVLRYSEHFGLELALIAEAQSRGWI